MTSVVVPQLPQLLHDPDADVASAGVRAGPKSAKRRRHPLLCGLLESELEPNVCAAAVEVLAEVGGPEALPILERCAARFRGTAFLEFSIRITADRIRAHSSQPRE
jgi:hypothetical protein